MNPPEPGQVLVCHNNGFCESEFTMGKEYVVLEPSEEAAEVMEMWEAAIREDFANNPEFIEKLLSYPWVSVKMDNGTVETVNADMIMGWYPGSPYYPDVDIV